MIKVAGCWEQGWNTPILEYDLWEMPVREFCIDELIMCPVSGIDANVTEFEDIPAAMEANKDLVHVFIDEKGGIDLEDFVHPENALYIFGKVSLSTMVAYNSNNADTVRVKTPTGLNLMWPHQVLCLLMYDRMKK